MDTLKLLDELLSAPGSLWSMFIFCTSLMLLGMYLGWSAKFIYTRWNMVTLEAMSAHQKEDVRMFQTLKGEIQGLKESIEDFKNVMLNNERGFRDRRTGGPRDRLKD